MWNFHSCTWSGSALVSTGFFGIDRCLIWRLRKEALRLGLQMYSMVAKGTGPTHTDLSTRRAALPQDKERTLFSVANFPRTID